MLADLVIQHVHGYGSRVVGVQQGATRQYGFLTQRPNLDSNVNMHAVSYDNGINTSASLRLSTSSLQV
jgi:hypothetical protein